MARPRQRCRGSAPDVVLNVSQHVTLHLCMCSSVGTRGVKFVSEENFVVCSDFCFWFSAGRSNVSSCRNVQKGAFKARGGNTSIRVVADPEHIQVLMMLGLSCSSCACFFQSANILDDQPEPSYAPTERDLNVSQMETFRRPNPVADNAGRRRNPTQITGKRLFTFVVNSLRRFQMK